MFVSWNKLLKKVSYYIKLISENFENTSLVKRTRLNDSGLTEKGRLKQNRLNEDFKRLENDILNH